MFDSNPNTHHHDIPFDDERAFAYGEHPGYHMRERIFSAFEVCSQDGDDSIDLGADGRAIEEPMYTMPMRPDEEFDLELDIDDENDFEGILTEFKKKPDTELSQVTTTNQPSFQFMNIIQPAINTDMELIDSDREDCCANQSQQQDNANDSTYHSIHEHDCSLDFVSANFADLSFQHNKSCNLSIMLSQPTAPSPTI